MIFTPTSVDGAWTIDIEPFTDDRGLFARTFCHDEFAEQGLDTRVAQCSTSLNRTPGTLRGMHWQIAPHEETKLVRVTTGAIFDVVIDLRPDSSTYCRWFGTELSAENRRALFIPTGCAHGFITLEPDSEVYYQMSQVYHGPSQRGVRYNDPAFGIVWPRAVEVITDKDRSYPDFQRATV